ncbi:Cysteinyl-tRNA synthetase [hydrothermal vent metagenome]|uniref:Cysteine--tRNA ligase n=1 Tax=hydrothermal vent metagenome TaxID=652676 RepID=A0A3B0ZY53_9ZZZZ
MLEIYNSLTRKSQPFSPLDANNVRLYVCGMTVYDYCHIGHARVLVVFDVVYRYLTHIYGADHVTYIRNITDIDDKIITRANERGLNIAELTEEFIEAMNEDAQALGVLSPNQEPRATAHMQQIIDMILALVDKDYAYQAENGDVYYAVAKFEAYGQLSGRQLEDLRAGARVEVDEAKRDPLDFVLWKSAKPNEPHWDSPWGKGRPGWHIECSAMSTHCLGNHFDIHGGGMDLKFPHHENEIAQSCGATGEAFANVWMHNGFVQIDNEKMAKSLGNFFTIREVLERYDPEVLRYFILSSHYRGPLNYSNVHLDNSKNALTTLYTALRGIKNHKSGFTQSEYSSRFFAAMDNDFATSEAQAILFELAHEINKLKSSQPEIAANYAFELKSLGKLLGLLQRDAEEFLQAGQKGELSADEIEQKIAQRNQARVDKDFALSDKIRDELQNAGVVLEDGAGATSWRRL